MVTPMVYFCYIHREAGGAPHFEVLAETSPRGARDRAAQMLSQHESAVRAEVWDGDELVFTLPRGGQGAARRPDVRGLDCVSLEAPRAPASQGRARLRLASRNRRRRSPPSGPGG
jgi:hypothetical protein